jgi:hypothetical protein
MQASAATVGAADISEHPPQGFGPSRRDSAISNAQDELRNHRGLHRPADDPTTEEIPHHGQVQPALAGSDVAPHF